MVSRILNSLNSRRKQLGENEKGFTLIELLVVVIIIGILAAIAIPVYLGVQANAKDAGVKSDITNAKTAVVAYQTEEGKLPTDLSALGTYGYTEPVDATGNYGTKPALSVVGTTGAAGFCIAAESISKKKFAASDLTGVTEGTCATGVFQPKGVTP